MITGYEIVAQDTGDVIHTVEIAPERRAESNSWADKVFDGLVQRVDLERYFIRDITTQP